MTSTAVLLVVLIACRAVPPRRSSSGDAQHPNVLLIVIDTLRADHMSLYGYARRTTPYLDALRPRLRYFRSAVTQAPQTAPSIATVFTGVPPRAHGLQFDPSTSSFPPTGVPVLNRSFVTLAEEFKENGYSTLGITANPWVTAAAGFGKGFDRFVEWKEVDPVLPINGRRVLAHMAPQVRAGAATPQFIYAHFMDTHAPYEKGHKQYVSTRGVELSINGKAHVSANDLQYMLDLYDSDILYVDQLLRRTFEMLAATGGRWLVCLISDHGEEFSEHGGLGHGMTLYEELVRVPVIFIGDQVVDRYGVSDYPLQLSDVRGLLLAAAGLQDHPLAGLLKTSVSEPEVDPERTLTSELAGMAMVRKGQWKYVVTQQPFSEALYDLKADRGERRNIARRQRAVVAAFRAEAGKLWPHMLAAAQLRPAPRDPRTSLLVRGR